MSKHLHDKHAWQLRSEHNRVEVLPIAHPQGTTIEVRHLFHNTPVRRKFLKSEHTEFQYIKDVVKRVALSVRQLSLTLQHNDRQILRVTPATNTHTMQLRLRKLLGAQFTDAALAVDVERLDLRLQGWVLPPEQSRAHADIHYFFVNGRMVKDRLLNHAVRTAFGQTLAVGRYPGYVLYLNCPATEVDVNVHPTKYEVRFQQARLVHDFVQHTLQQLFTVSTSQTKTVIAPTRATPKEYANMAVNTINETVSSYQTKRGTAVSMPTHFANACRLLGKRFILATTTADFFLIDAFKAQQWLLRKFIGDAITTKGLRAQPLLLPTTVQLSTPAVNALSAQTSLLQRYGIELHQVAPDAVMVRTLPQCLRDVDVASLLRALPALQRQAEVIECLVNYAVNVKELSLAEMQQLIADLSLFSPTQLIQEKLVKRFTHNDLIKLFL